MTMTPEIWIALAAANFMASLVPGQNAAFVGSATARAGVWGGGLATSGILAAEMIWSVAALLIALGARELDPRLWTALQIGSGIVLVALGYLTFRASGATGPGAVRPRSGLRISAQGLWIGLANPIALVFFLSLFPAFVPAGSTQADAGMVLFYASAILASSAAGIAPYLVVSGALARGGFSVPLQMSCGSMLVLLGGLVLVRLAI
ncbi:LysE family transporter [Sulfitobacter sp. AS92]|uniref:LysE family translocator n=1 Tax=Sulfitobacter sp. AS92 TaxID=3135783 RepID=UPI003182AA61